jgi:hypothetical protein
MPKDLIPKYKCMITNLLEINLNLKKKTHTTTELVNKTDNKKLELYISLRVCFYQRELSSFFII